jgi:hypothetical protein
VEDAYLTAQEEAFLDHGIATGRILLSGRLSYENGFVLLLRATSPIDLASYLETNPLWASGLAEFDVQEFFPNRFPEALKSWIEPAVLPSFCDPDGDGCTFI